MKIILFSLFDGIGIAVLPTFTNIDFWLYNFNSNFDHKAFQNLNLANFELEIFNKIEN